ICIKPGVHKENVLLQGQTKKGIKLIGTGVSPADVTIDARSSLEPLGPEGCHDSAIQVIDAAGVKIVDLTVRHACRSADGSTRPGFVQSGFDILARSALGLTIRNVRALNGGEGGISVEAPSGVKIIGTEVFGNHGDGIVVGGRGLSSSGALLDQNDIRN